MKSIKVLVTGAGAPGIKGTVYSLKNNPDNRQVTVVGTDINEDVIGAYICDKFYVIPPATDKDRYLNSLINICKSEKINVLLPQNTFELEILMNNYSKFEKISTKVIVASKSSLDIANNKYLLMNICKRIGVPVGEFYKVSSFDNLLDKAKILGWPSKNIVVKPPISNGMRGVRIISEKIDRKEIFYNEKPSSLYTTMDSLREILGSNFPDLIVTEYLPGKEYSVDVFRSSDNLTVIPRLRHQVKSGITFYGEVINNQDLIKYCSMISSELDMQNCYGFQFKLDSQGTPKILESNPRIQGTMVLATLSGANIIYACIKKSLNEDIQEFNVKWGTKFLRYWGGIGISDQITEI